MTSVEFTQQIRFALHHLFEISVLDKGPGQILVRWLDEVAPGLHPQTPGQRLHQLLVHAIEQMKPAEPLDSNLPHHRSYLILKRRYLDGTPVQKLEVEFNSSSRQFRRENHRAIEELVLLLWQMSPAAAQSTLQHLSPVTQSTARSPLAGFDLNTSAINLLDLVVDAAETLAVIISNNQVHVVADIPPDLPTVTADRVALRLALIKLLRLAIAHTRERVIQLQGRAVGQQIILELDGISGVQDGNATFAEAAQLFALAEGELTLETPTSTSSEIDRQSQRIVAKLPIQHRLAVLVVDDDPAMSRIIQRFLALKPVQVISCNSTDDVVRLASETQPVLILLDVLMPKRDGWDVLQELKANPDTYHIRLAVCSIWDERELALSLGADLFFQKPIGRAELLDCVEQNL